MLCHPFSGLFLRTSATALRALYGIVRRICRTLINQTGANRLTYFYLHGIFLVCSFPGGQRQVSLSLPFSLFLPAHPHRAIGAVFGPVGLRSEHGPAHGAAFHFVPALADLGVKGRIQREDGGSKPPAQQRIGNALDAHTFLSIVQKQAVPVTIIAAFMRQLPGLAVLPVIHFRYAHSSCVLS